MPLQLVSRVVRGNGRDKSASSGFGCYCGVVSLLNSERRQDVRTNEGRVRRDRLLLEDQPLHPRVHLVPGGLHCAERGDEEIRPKYGD